MGGPFPIPRTEDPQPEPVKVAGYVAASISAIVSALAMVGVLSASTGDSVNTAVAAVVALVPGVVGAVATIVGAFHARSQVTPVASPRATDGTPLVKSLNT